MRWRVNQDDSGVWHRWFAWHPVNIDGDRVWLETVMRRDTFVPCHPCGEFAWEYQLVAEPTSSGRTA